VKPPLLILRPRPGGVATVARAAALGWHSVATPLFTVSALPWSPPAAADFDAVMMTSANAARRGGAGLAGFRRLPLYAVGRATAEAARQAGFVDVRTGEGNADDLLARAAADGVGALLHLAGRERRHLSMSGIAIDQRVVYGADAADELPPAALAALADGAIVLLHSPRAAALFAELADAAGVSRATVRIAAISPAVLAAAGAGWAAGIAASSPDDDALLAAAARMCE
jgi:uroporphyrinogen-III synthase